MKFIATVSIGVLSVLFSSAQNNTDISHKQFQSVIPQSPNTASLGKYGEIPVGIYTGVPSVSIPIYEINTGKLKLPVTLSYHGGGIKVEEIASWAGLGWSISAGGQVTRQVRGVPDESPYGYLTQYRKIYEYEQMNTTQKHDYLQDLLHYEFDSEPDMFSYSAGAISGEFFYDTTGSFITIPRSKIIINGLNGFVISDNDGTAYYFTTPETTTATSLANNAVGATASSVSAWLLSKIVSATGTDSIVFSYELNITNFTSFSSQTKYYPLQSPSPDCIKTPTTYTSTNSVLGYRLKRIAFKNGEILFNKNAGSRLDVPDDNALESIVIHSDNNSYYKKYMLHQHYAISNGAPAEYDRGYKEFYRLILDSISVFDNGAAASYKYAFDYDSPDQLPARLSFSQDYWGYFNNAGNGNDIVPSAFIDFAYWSVPVYVPGANRNPSESFAKKGILTKITYPTGGSTSFVYEGNTALTTRQIPGGVQTMGNISLGSTLGGSKIFTSAQFNIPNCGYNASYAAVNAVVNNSNCGNGSQNLECPVINIINAATAASFPLTATGTLLLPVNQTYYIRADLSGVTNQDVFNNFFVSLNWTACTPVQTPGGYALFNSYVGGLRVKEITSYDPVGQVSETKKYDYTWPGTTNSSGYLTCFPEFVGEIRQLNGQGSNCFFKTISSVSNYPMLSTHGSTVGYSFVREIYGTNGQNGIREYRYLSPGDIPDAVDANFPFPPSTSNEWQRGNLLYERTLKAQNINGQITYAPVSKKMYAYTLPLTVIARKGLKAGVFWMDNSTNNGSLEIDTAVSYNIQSGLFVPAGDTVVQYGNNSTTDSIVTVSAVNSYSQNSFLAKETSSQTSAGKYISTKIIYASDYALAPATSDPVTQGIRNSTTATTPIETYTVLKNSAGQEFVTSGMLTTYLPDKPLPDKIFVLKTAAPVPLTAFVQSYVDASGAFIKDSRYAEEVLFNGYDEQANLKGQQKKDNMRLSYLYDYKSSLPVAQAVNAAQEDIAYTSFESEGKGSWDFSGVPQTDSTAPTGSKSYFIGADEITRPVNASKSFIVSFWKKGTVNVSPAALYRTGKTINGWTYVEYLVSGANSIKLSGFGTIDELRLYPRNASMTTYTFEPLLGITSQSGVNGEISYYEYDSLGRLRFVKDADHNTVKAIDYQYQKGVNQ